MINDLGYMHNAKKKLNEVIEQVNTNTDAVAERVIKISSVFDPVFATLQEGDSVELTGYHDGSTVGGGSGVVKTARHNGGTAISLTRERPSDWGNDTGGEMTAWFLTSETEELCFVRKEEIPTLQQFGAIADESTDIYLSIKKALEVKDAVAVPSGKYHCSKMIEVELNKAVILGNGAEIARYAAYSSETTPVFWLKGNFSQLVGLTFSSSRIRSETASPNGVVLLGHRDMLSSHANVNYCTLRNVRISGATPYGRTDGSNDSVLVVQNPQFNGFTSYFHNLSNILLENANVGLELRGWANGLTGGNIHGYRLGNTTAGTAAFLWVRGALDNTMSDFFFHQSSGSTGMIMEELDNTANGGNIHSPAYSSFKGLVFEQGGASAKGLVATAGTGNYIEMRENVAEGSTYSTDFAKDNIVIRNRSITTKDITAANLSSSERATFMGEVAREDESSGFTIVSETQFYLTDLLENTVYKLIDIDMLNNSRSVMVEIDCATRLKGIGGGGGGCKVVYRISRSGAVTSDGIMNFRSGGAIPQLAFIAGNVATLALKIPNNGTTTTGHVMTGTIKIVGRKDSIYAPTYYTAPSTITGTTDMGENTLP